MGVLGALSFYFIFSVGLVTTSAVAFIIITISAVPEYRRGVRSVYGIIRNFSDSPPPTNKKQFDKTLRKLQDQVQLERAQSANIPDVNVGSLAPPPPRPSSVLPVDCAIAVSVDDREYTLITDKIIEATQEDEGLYVPDGYIYYIRSGQVLHAVEGGCAVPISKRELSYILRAKEDEEITREFPCLHICQ